MIDVRYTQELPNTVRGLTVQCGMDEYIVLINATLTESEQRRTISHELAHIKCGHFDSNKPIAELEQEAHRMAMLYE